MGGGTGGGGDDDLITSINVTPLVDVVLVLLIILMVTASYIVSHSIPMELPQAETGDPEAQQPRTLTVSINETGQLHIDAEPISDEVFRRRIREYVASLPNRQESRATIAADGRIQHSRFVYVLDSLRREGVTRYAINVRPEDLAQ
ncbi:ExbD/TolR family protein [Sandaracinus amylolyticus]|uniref:Biopolymer transport protein ExbD/TolR n=1 Tax=Sandaracinus amylolyticus TaxID=927083 RepID=A0A0F6W297_9BACT|nr:biopolymer transporter ExbD [Sandaracinus amylolyticus]AKF05662.1 Biopolymer transport protein ExbD/TolR [Sandaracinus amylolyticus]